MCQGKTCKQIHHCFYDNLNSSLACQNGIARLWRLNLLCFTLWTIYGKKIWVKFGSRNSLLSDGTKHLTNVDLPSNVFCRIPLRATWQEMRVDLMNNMCSNITLSKLLLFVPPTNELMWPFTFITKVNFIQRESFHYCIIRFGCHIQVHIDMT